MALVSATVLLFEVAITRVLSVVLWYHFAFLVVSLAMLGLGLPGVWLALRPPRRDALAHALLAAGFLVPGAVAAILGPGGRVLGEGSAASALGVLAQPGMLLVIACVLLPFLALGTAVCVLLLRAEVPRLGRVYAADLLGATAGALAVVPLLRVAATPLVIAGSGLLPLAAVFALGEGTRRFRKPALAIALLLAGAMLWGSPFRVRYSKARREPEGVLFEKWTPTARITVFPGF